MSKNDSQSYETCLSAAGATVHAIEYMGSYQGIWIADATLPDGRRGFINGYYGSCSGCDALQAELDYNFHVCVGADDGDYHTEIPGCPTCAENLRQMQEFGARYFDDLKTRDETLDELRKDAEWSSDASEAITWIEARTP